MIDSELEFQKIHDSFLPKILRYLTRLAGQYDAEDLTQEVFAKVSQALKNFRGDSQLSTWIYRIATNAALDRLRSPSSQQLVQKRVSSYPTEEGEEERYLQVGEKTPSAELGLIQKEMNECIRNFIEDLPEDYRTAIVLSEMEGLKNREIAEILGVTLETVKIRLHRARTKLKRDLETHCSFYQDERGELACDLKTAFREFRKTH